MEVEGPGPGPGVSTSLACLVDRHSLFLCPPHGEGRAAQTGIVPGRGHDALEATSSGLRAKKTPSCGEPQELGQVDAERTPSPHRGPLLLAPVPGQPSTTGWSSHSANPRPLPDLTVLIRPRALQAPSSPESPGPSLTGSRGRGRSGRRRGHQSQAGHRRTQGS